MAGERAETAGNDDGIYGGVPSVYASLSFVSNG